MTDDKSRTGVWVALFAAALLPLVYAMAIEKFLSADGAYYFTQILDDQRFTTFAWSRNHSVYLTQSPLMAALWAGVTNWRGLEAAYAFGLLLPHLLGFGLCCLALRGQPKWPLMFPILSLLAATIPSDYVLISEHHPLIALAWPALFFAVRKAPFKPWEIVIVALLTLGMTRMYEAAILIGPVLAVFFATRRAASSSERSAHAVIALICLAAAAVALVSFLYPRDPNNKAGFAGALLVPLLNPQFMIAIAFVVPFLLSLKAGWERLALVALAAMVIMLIPVHAAAEAVPHRLGWRAGISFSSRTLSVTFIPPLLFVAGILMRVGRRTALSAQHMRVFVLFVVLAGAHSLVETRHWTRFRSQFKDTLRTHTGFVPLADSPTRLDSSGWGWNNPLLSYLWSGGDVHSIILNADHSWNPFNPREDAVLSRYIPPPTFLEAHRGPTVQRFD